MRAPKKQRQKRSTVLSRELSDAVFGNVDLFSLIVEHSVKKWDAPLTAPPEPFTQVFTHGQEGALPLPCVGQGYSDVYCAAWRSEARRKARSTLRTIGIIQTVSQMGARVGLVAEGGVLSEIHARVRACRHEFAMALAVYTEDLIGDRETSANRFYDPSDCIEELIYDRSFRTSKSSMSDGIDLALLIGNISENRELSAGRLHVAIRELCDYIYKRHVPMTAQGLDAALGGKCLFCRTTSGNLMTCKLCKGPSPTTSEVMISVESNGYDSRPLSSTTAQLDMPWCGDYRIKSGGDHGPNGEVVPYVHKCAIDVPFTSALHMVTIFVEVDRTDPGPQTYQRFDDSDVFDDLRQWFGDVYARFKIDTKTPFAPTSRRTSAEDDAFRLFASRLRDPENTRSLMAVLRALADVHCKRVKKEYDDVRAGLDRGAGVLPPYADRAVFRMSLPMLTHGFVVSLIPQALFARSDAPCSIADLLRLSNTQAIDAIRAERERETKRVNDRSRHNNARRKLWLKELVDALRRDPALGPFWRNAPIAATDADLSSYYEQNAPDCESVEDKRRGFWCPNTDLIATWRMKIDGKYRNFGRALIRPVEPGKDAGCDLKALFQWLTKHPPEWRRKRFVESALHHFRSLHAMLRPTHAPTVAYLNTEQGRMLNGISALLKRIWDKQTRTHRPRPLQLKSATSSEWDTQSLKLNNPNVVIGMWIRAMLDDRYTIQIEATHVFERMHSLHASAHSKGPFRPKPEDHRYKNNGALGVALTLSAYTDETDMLSSENLRMNFVIALPCLPGAISWYSGYAPSGLQRIKRLLAWHDDYDEIFYGDKKITEDALTDRERAFFGPATRREWLRRAKKACQIATDSLQRDQTPLPLKLRRLYTLEQILSYSWIKTPTWGPPLTLFDLEDALLVLERSGPEGHLAELLAFLIGPPRGDFLVCILVPQLQHQLAVQPQRRRPHVSDGCKSGCGSRARRHRRRYQTGRERPERSASS